MVTPDLSKKELLARLAGLPVLKEVVSRRLRLIRAGHRWKAHCPFHHEKTPSFYAGNWWFICYGCGAEGHVVDFVQRYDGLSEVDAIDVILAEVRSQPESMRLRPGEASGTTSPTGLYRAPNSQHRDAVLAAFVREFDERSARLPTVKLAPAGELDESDPDVIPF